MDGVTVRPGHHPKNWCTTASEGLDVEPGKAEFRGHSGNPKAESSTKPMDQLLVPLLLPKTRRKAPYRERIYSGLLHGKGVAELTTAEVCAGAHTWADQGWEKREYSHSAGFLLCSFLSSLGPQPWDGHSHLGGGRGWGVSSLLG